MKIKKNFLLLMFLQREPETQIETKKVEMVFGNKEHFDFDKET